MPYVVGLYGIDQRSSPHRAEIRAFDTPEKIDAMVESIVSGLQQDLRSLLVAFSFLQQYFSVRT